ncbi:hypothetical protein HBF26_18240 [Luteibacter jiangsuensis]|uniref:Excisionase family DNA binding protein n=1 Tax=Luteibacter jiangsuensis TaxID=637577 RepID=A0ABX0Q920_9GAMM|nr:hypothetical protein [Luteibacter jiangsuensis]NID06832.1 hypothetical protein [Luteibacter jiangsuensis]
MTEKSLNIAGKDWFTEEEAAFYCGVSLRQFQTHYGELGIQPRRFMGRKLFARDELSAVIERSDPWHRHTQSAEDRQSFIDAIVQGRKEVEAAARLAQKEAKRLGLSVTPNLAPVPLRPFKPRKRKPTVGS